MKTNNYDHLIEKYLLNQMSEKEKQEFELLVKSNPLLSEELKLQSSLFESANDSDFKKIFPQLKSAENKFLSTKTKKPFLRFSSAQRLLVGFIMILLVIVIYYFFLYAK